MFHQESFSLSHFFFGHLFSYCLPMSRIDVSFEVSGDALNYTEVVRQIRFQQQRLSTLRFTITEIRDGECRGRD